MVKAGPLSTLVFPRALAARAVRVKGSSRTPPLPEDEQIRMAIRMLADDSQKVAQTGISILAAKGSAAVPFLLREMPEKHHWYTHRVVAALVAIGNPVLEHSNKLLGECWEWGGREVLIQLPSASHRLGELLLKSREDILRCARPDEALTEILRTGVVISARIISVLEETGCPETALPALYAIYKAASRADEKNPKDPTDPIIFETGAHAIKDPAEKVLVRSGGIRMVAQILQDEEIPEFTRQGLATYTLFRDEHHLKLSEDDVALLIPLTKDPKLEPCRSSIFQALARARIGASAAFIHDGIKKGDADAIEVAWGLGTSEEEIDTLIDLFLSRDLHRDHLIHLAQDPKNQVITRLTDEFLRRKGLTEHVKGNFFKILYRGATKEEGLPAFRKLLKTKKWQEAAIGGLAHFDAVDDLVAVANNPNYPLKTRKRAIWGLSCVCRLGRAEDVPLEQIEAMTRAATAFFGYLGAKDPDLRAEAIELIRSNVFPVTLGNLIILAKGTKLPCADLIEAITRGYLAYLTSLTTDSGINLNFDQSREIIEDLGKVGSQLLQALPSVSRPGRKQIKQFTALLLSFLQSSIEYYGAMEGVAAANLCYVLREALYIVTREGLG